MFYLRSGRFTGSRSCPPYLPHRELPRGGLPIRRITATS